MPIAIKKDALGVGLFIASDQSGANTFSTVIAQASVSYIKTLGKNRNHRLSAGFQIGFTHQSVKSENFQFANQFDQTNQFSSSTSSNENIAKNKTGYLNMNFGLLWYGKLTDRVSMYSGASFYNVTTPKNDILANQKHDLYWRLSAQLGLDVKLGNRYHLLPSVLFMHQGVSNQLNTGLGFGVDLTYDMALTIGLYNRINPHGKINNASGTNADAIIPYAGFDVKGFKIAVSYDATLSKLKNARSGVGALELMLGYTIKRRDYNFKNSLVCPRF
jgi:type IX secretion system PorP/SprF family membrane protein